MELEPVASRHLAWMRLANKRPRTVYCRERVLVRLTGWAQGPILYLTHDQLTAYQQWRAVGDEHSEPIGSESIRIEVSHLHEFYGWAMREKLLREDPSANLTVPKRKDYRARPMADSAFAAALAHATPTVAAMIALARYSGLRACEIARLDWRDVRLGASIPSLTVREGKGGFSREVHISPALTEILRALPHRTGPVIRRADGREGYNTAARISQRAAEFLHEHADTEPGEALHALRHSFGTKAFQGTKDLRAVQEEMGHRSVSTTQIYTAIGNDARARVAQAAAELDLEAS